MIETGFEKRVKVQQIVESQLPEFILSESPKSVDFLKQYYISQEYQGGPLDISENLDQYLKVDNLTSDIIVGFTSLTNGINLTSDTIQVISTKGFPSEYGLLKIDNEIITYTGLTNNTFTGCIRGFSGITSYRSENNSQELKFSSSKIESHSSGTKVQNLSSLFLKEFYKKLKFFLTPGLEDVDFVSNLNVGNFIKEARTFYESKGTEESFRILFNVLYGVNPKIIDLKEFLLRPSSSNFVRREVIIIEAISGNPNNLVGQTIFKQDDLETSASVSEVEIFTRSQKVGYAQTYYRVGLFVGFEENSIKGSFEITPHTKVLETVPAGSSTITVDSTIGFEKSGTLITSGNRINYSDKSINQFFNCVSIENEVLAGSSVRSNDIYYGYENGDLNKKVEFRITGSLSSFIPTSDITSVNEGEDIYVKNLGEKISDFGEIKSYKQKFFNSWIYNTSSRYEIDLISGSTFTLKSDIDDPTLAVGDSVDILRSKSQIIAHTNAVVSSINKSLKQVILNNLSGFTPVNGLYYDLRRNIRTCFSSGANVSGGNNQLFSNIQNSYNDSNEYFYVASNSLPSYEITKNISYAEIDSAVAESTIQGFNPLDGTYSIISFPTNVSFLTGDKVYYLPENSPIQGLVEGIYYVKVIGPGNKVKLYSSRSFIDIDDYLTFYPPSSNNGYHKFILDIQKSLTINAQKILRRFPNEQNIDNVENTETRSGSVGILVNGVEIINYKSEDQIFYGPLSNLKIINSGSNYDVINPPSITITSPSVGTTALIQPVVSGSVKEVLVDPSEFDISSVISITITGGNGNGAILEPVLSKRFREIAFNAQNIFSLGGIDYVSDTLTFLSNHNLSDGEKIVYNKNGNNEVGVGSFNGSNTNQNKTLVNGGVYYTKVVNNSTIKLYENENDYISGINTVGFTTIGNQGVHKFRLFNGKNNISKIKVINPGDGYTHRQLKVKTSGISTSENTITFPNHNFKDGEIVTYSTTGSTITGLSTSNQYYILTNNTNNFKLANAGIGGTIKSNYERKKYVAFESTGSGYQIFSYPQIQLNINISYGSTITGIVTATPIIRGKIIDCYLYESGAGYGSTTLNLHKKPIISINTGTGAQLLPFIVDGKIEKVIVLNGGSNYNAAPDLSISGDGTGAILRPIVVNGTITQVVVINSGIGYLKDNTDIIVTSPGNGAILESSIRNLTLNNHFRFGNEILIQGKENLQYGIVGYSTEIGNKIKTDDGSQHSPIVGWAYDGNPIYGPYSFSDPENVNSSLKILESGYNLDINSVLDRPIGFLPGFFVEDYKFDASGDLDIHNGRYCKTPDFPKGVYAYFCGIKTDLSTSNLVSNFPYFIGNSFKSKFDIQNKLLDQNFDFNSSRLIRNTFPYNLNKNYADNEFLTESYEISNQITKVDSISKGSVDSFTVVESGKNYKVGDVVNFNSDGEGGGLTVSVSSLVGNEITNLSTTIETYESSVISWKNQNEIEIKIDPYHNLKDSDNIILSGLSTNISRLAGNYKIEVKTETNFIISQIPANSFTGVVTDIYLNKNFENISIGSTLGIGTETLSVLNIFENEKVLRVKRGISGVAHTISSKVIASPNSFIITKSLNYFESQPNEKVYFNPNNCVGVGTTSGIGVGVNFTIGEITNTISVPTQSIYLPNHPFKTNQRILLYKQNSSSPILVSKTSGGSSFNLPSSGNFEALYVINKSKDFIGLVTSVGLTTSSDGLFFLNNGSNDYEYYFETNYKQITCKVEKLNCTVSVSTDHQLKTGDNIKLNVLPSTTVGIGTSAFIKVKYNNLIDKLLVNTVGFGSNSVITANNKINIQNHGYKTGDKIFYNSLDLISSGLNTGSYFIHRIDDSSFQLCETYYDAFSNPPSTVSIGGTGGLYQEISLINPKIDSIRGNNLKFDLSDTSLVGYEFNIYEDFNFRNKVVSIGNTTAFSINRIGNIGISTNASLTITYNSSIPSKLYYNIEKSGFISTSDTEVKNYSEISFIDSKYNNNYSVIGSGTTTFIISLLRKPEVTEYNPSLCNILEYTTTSKNAKGGIKTLKLLSGGSNYKKIPSFKDITTDDGENAVILANSKTIGRIKNTTILDQGFEYQSDKTLNPEAYISPQIKLINSSEIVNVTILDGGKNYISPPDIIVVDGISRNKVDSGLLSSQLSSNSIRSVEVVRKPKGLSYSNNEIYAVNNTNGVGINTVISSTSGIITCYLMTPILGYSTPPFTVGDQIYVEGIENKDSTGTGFNSQDCGYKFFTVTNFQNTNPAILEFSVSGFTTNPGIAKTSQSAYASIIKYENYPKFKVETSYSKFNIGEFLLTKNNSQDQYQQRDLKITESGDDYIKVVGTYELSQNEFILGQLSGSLAKIDSILPNFGQFSIRYALNKDYQWSNDVGKLNVDYQVLPDNDYYQNLSYTVKSPITYEVLSNPVNRLVHAAGLKNFADTEIKTITNVGYSNTSSDTTTVVRDILDEKRVDTVNFYDNVLDIDTNSTNNTTRSKFLKLQSKALSDYIECRTNQVLRIDNFSNQFRNKNNVTEGYVNILGYDNQFSEFLIQTKNDSGDEIQLTELLVLNDSDNSVTIQKSSLSNTTEELGDISSFLDSFGNLYLRFTPKDEFDTDYDIKVLSSEFNSTINGIGTQSIGFSNLIGVTKNVGIGSTEILIGISTSSVTSICGYFHIYNQVSKESDFVEMEIDHDGENVYISEFYTNNGQGFVGGSIGTFGVNINSGILSLDYSNNSNNLILVRGNITSFGSTSIGIGTYRFKTNSQLDGSERSLKIESNYSSQSSIGTVFSLDKSLISSIKSLVRVSYGKTTSLHQVMMIHDGSDIYVSQYPFISVGSTGGCGIFSGSYSGSNLDLIFYPDQDITGIYNIQSLNKIFYSDTDTLNDPPDLNYGSVNQKIDLAFYNAPNNNRVNRLDFNLESNQIPIFAKTFDPSDSDILDLATGIFTIENHFFNTGEKLNYTPNSSVIGSGITSVNIGITTVLPSTVYAIKLNNNQFKLSTSSQNAYSGIGVTFTSYGLGNLHQLEMTKRLEKSIISIDGVIQYPIRYTPLSYSLSGNGGQIGFGNTYISVTGISSIKPTDIIKIDEEYVKVVAVGFGTTSSGPIDNVGITTLIQVERGFVGSIATSHLDLSPFRVYRGSYNISGSKIFFTEPPKGGSDNNIDPSNLQEVFSSFNGRVFLQKDYTNNVIYDDISDKFTGIGQTYTLTVSGINTTGIETGSGILLINDVYQTPTTENNAGNNYILSQSGGSSQLTFTGITSSNGSIIISPIYVNQNQLPRGGQIISLGSTNGLGYSPLVGAAVTPVVGSGGSIVSVGLGTTDIVGSGYRGTVSIAVTSLTGNGANISAVVGAGGSLTFNIINGGSGYATTNTVVQIPDPSYSDLPITGVSRLGIGSTSESGFGLLISLEVGASSTTGIGSTLFEVKSFKINRQGYGFRNGDVFTPVGLVTDKKLNSPISRFELTVLETFSDTFAAWQFGSLDYIDSISSLQDGNRKRFPLVYNGQLLSFQKNTQNIDSSSIDLNNLLLIFVNGVLQDPGVNYSFDGGTTFEFTEAPESTDIISIYFYRGSRDVDSLIVNVNESIKNGDIVQVIKNNLIEQTKTQSFRTVVGIKSSDVLETMLYSSDGIDVTNYKPMSWTKQKVDKIISGEIISKSRDSIETQIYPTSKVIKNISSSDTQIFVDDAYFFNYEENESAIVISSFDALVLDINDPVSAAVTAVVSAAGTIQSLNIVNVGSGYTGASIEVKIAPPKHIGIGIGTTATANISIINGSLSNSIIINNPGFGYSITNQPKVIVPVPSPTYENILDITTVEGFSGIITGITTTTGTSGNPLALKFFLRAPSFVGLSVNYPICIVDTKVGNGVTSIDTNNASVVGIGTSFLDNIYYIHSIVTSGNNAEIVSNIKSNSSVVGIATTGSTTLPLGRFSWGRFSGITRSSSPVSIGVTGLKIDSGLTTFPTIQRRGYGLRDTGSLRKDL